MSDDQELRKSYQELPMPEDLALTFDRKRWDDVTLSRTNSAAKRTPTSKLSWFVGAAAAMAALLLIVPHWMTRSSTAKPSFIKTSRTVWHQETFDAIDMISQTQGWAFARAGPGVFRTVSGFDRWKRVGFLPPLGSGLVFTHVFNVRQAVVIMVQQPKAIVTTGRVHGNQRSSTHPSDPMVNAAIALFTPRHQSVFADSRVA